MTKLPSTGSRANNSRPAVINSIPATSGGLIPKRMTSFAERPSEKAPMIKLDGKNARPTWSGLYPRTRWR